MNEIIKPRILVIEDEFAMRMILKEYLSPDYNVVSVSSVKDAYAELSLAPFEVVLVDLNLPDGTGMEVVKILAEQHKKTVILVLTGDMFQKTVKRAKNLGAHDYLIKPIDKQVFLKRVKKALLRPLP